MSLPFCKPTKSRAQCLAWGWVLAIALSATAGTDAFCGGLKGTITNASGEVLPFATIFVKQLGTGTASNADGYYEISLAPGQYEVTFQYLGYQPKVAQVTIGGDYKAYDVALKPQAMLLREVQVKAGKEDPAYTIMRKAIGKSKFHTQQLDHYAAQVYIKGSGRLVDAPFFARRALKKQGIDSTYAYTLESVSEISYTRPNQYKERVISIKKIGNDNDTPPNQYINGSFYENELGGAISPLSPRAFSYYRFTYLGAFQDRGYTVNKIRVTPRVKGDLVFSGVIYILEDYWSIHSINLVTSKFGIKVRIKQVYAPIAQVAWLPISHKFEVAGAVFGFDFEYNYLATVSDYEITLNPDLDNTLAVIDETLDAQIADTLSVAAPQEGQDVYQQLARRKALSRKELRKLMDEYEKEELRQSKEPRAIANITYTIDSAARERDSTYWQQIRPVPLSRLEVVGYGKMDSLQRAEARKDSLRSSGNPIGRGGFLFGEDIELGPNSKLRFKSLASHFNTVEGVNLAYGVRYHKKNSPNGYIEIGPTLRYAFARDRLLGYGQAVWAFGKKHLPGKLDISGGRYVQQLNADNPIQPIVNDITTLLLEENYLKIFEKDFLEIRHQKQLFRGFHWTMGLAWERRSPLANNATYRLVDREGRAYTENQPTNRALPNTGFVGHDALLWGTSLAYTPGQQYRIYNGEKTIVPGKYPTFTARYKKGVNDVLDSEVDFDFMALGMRYGFDVGIRGKADLAVEAGRFLRNDRLFFMDFKHFMGNRTPFQADNIEGYRLLDYYTHSTNDQYFSTHAQYQFRKMLLTQWPVLRLLGLKEGVMANYLNTPETNHYMELGYSISYIFRFLRLEAVASFEDGQYKDFGVRVGFTGNLARFSSE